MSHQDDFWILPSGIIKGAQVLIGPKRGGYSHFAGRAINHSSWRKLNAAYIARQDIPPLSLLPPILHHQPRHRRWHIYGKVHPAVCPALAQLRILTGTSISQVMDHRRPSIIRLPRPWAIRPQEATLLRPSITKHQQRSPRVPRAAHDMSRPVDQAPRVFRRLRLLVGTASTCHSLTKETPSANEFGQSI